ncbi:hypothetical protein G6F70_000914 [Rhizopus microsporus]|uniref:Uncharacterized protein n=2 Tax=Rhizopus TaxID=4842 RepID=A0A367K4F4_RHIAZ|nr:hypothetical protein G6F71_000666 [Rhizopus microsporus]RCH97142.1 hypothetical protein CU097_014311 [Rhizopus azygosporus]KAG1203917.1 hypothetical protein G6F70_000914 [Rhizopus microsporus]KAG1208903.1 hypothetical protein G6F69_006821 [Rhizopus microsporus]KAG1232527.1 hypothetical protein G6F67_004946 [Rhizopus microsporus]
MSQNTTPTTNATAKTLSSSKTFPRRIRSASARLFSSTKSNPALHKRYSCYFNSESNQQHISILNPSTWFPKIRCRSSSTSSSFSLAYSPSSEHYSPKHQHYSEPHASNLESLSSELEELYNNAKIEIDFATESFGSIYYEGDYSTAHSSFESCLSKYQSAMQTFGDTANSIKFRFRWETDIHQLRLRLDALPEVTHSIYD